MGGRRVDEISIEELVELIARRKAARVLGEDPDEFLAAARRRRWGQRGGRLFVLVEVGIILALAFSAVDWFRARDTINAAAIANLARVMPTPTTMPLISTAFLPGSHTPPTSRGGAQPIDASIPEHLRSLITAATPMPLPTVQPHVENAVRIVIPSIKVDAPVVEGDDWESLKLGVGHHLGSANPGETSNMVLSAHNDIYGEIFRYLSDMQLEDEIIVYTATRTYRYAVKAKRLIEPTQVEVMDPSRAPILTLISCYPYLIDTQRIVIVGELVEAAG